MKIKKQPEIGELETIQALRKELRGFKASPLGNGFIHFITGRFTSGYQDLIRSGFF